MKNTLRVLSILLVIMVSDVYADQVQPYVKIGGVELIENGISEGHKAIAFIGINIIDESKIEKTYTLEGWSMLEAVDEDPEMLQCGFRAGAEFKYMFDKYPLYPFVGINFENWNRDKRNEKYPDSFQTLSFLDTTFGIATEYKLLYAKVGGIYPIWAEADNSNPSGDLGFGVDVGLQWKKVGIGYSYKRISFSADDSQPDIESNFSLVRISYSF